MKTSRPPTPTTEAKASLHYNPDILKGTSARVPGLLAVPSLLANVVAMSYNTLL